MREFATWEQLQALKGVTSEGADLDFKENIEPTVDHVQLEAGKDIVALANTLGGNIIVGASTELSRTRCTGFHGLEPAHAAAVAALFEGAAKDRCRPTPFLSTHLIDMPGTPARRVVLVVRVGPSPIAPVGVSVRQPKNGCLADKAWIFPYRVGSQTEYLSPDQLGAFESMTARRAAALLDAIPVTERDTLELRWGAHSPVPLSCDVDLETVDSRLNVACFRQVGGHRAQIRIPLDEIATVWMEQPRKWTVALLGVLRPGPGGSLPWTYWPKSLSTERPP